MEDVFDRYQVPAFGTWNYSSHEFPITQCFESLVHAGAIGGHAFGDDGGLFRVAIPTTTYHHHHHHQRKMKNGMRDGRGGEKNQQQHYGKEQQWKQGRVCDEAAANKRRAPRRQRSPKAVDEDLYKIPSELICQKTKRKKMPRGVWLGCLGLNCVAA